MGLKPLNECREKRIQNQLKARTIVDSESLKIELKLFYVNGSTGFFSVSDIEFSDAVKGFLLHGEGENQVKAIEVFSGTSLADMITRDMLLSLDKTPTDKKKEPWKKVLLKRYYCRSNWKKMKVHESKCAFSKG